MNPRIHSYLDGEIPVEELTPAEREEAKRLQALLKGAPHLLPTAAPPELMGRVMERVSRLAGERASEAASAGQTVGSAGERSWVRWFWRPRTVTVRPAYGLLAAAALLLLVFFPVGETPTGTDHDMSPTADGVRSEGMSQVSILVQFRLEAPEATQVRLAGSFTEWEPLYELHEAAPGRWVVTVPLSPGIHDYGFLVDGQEWITDPAAPTVDDGFGGENSRMAIVLAEGGRES